MSSCNTYHLTWVSLTLDEGYLLTATLPDLQRGIAPLGPPAPALPPLQGSGVYKGKIITNVIILLKTDLIYLFRVFLNGSVVKNLPAKAGDTGSTSGSGRPQEKEMVTHSSILAWKIPWTEETHRATVQGVIKSWMQLRD